MTTYSAETPVKFFNGYQYIIVIARFFRGLVRWMSYSAAKQAKPSGKWSKDSVFKHLSIPGMLKVVRECFLGVSDPISA